MQSQEKMPNTGEATLPLDEITPGGGFTLLLDLLGSRTNLAGLNGARLGRTLDSPASFGHKFLCLYKSRSFVPCSIIIPRWPDTRIEKMVGRQLLNDPFVVLAFVPPRVCLQLQRESAVGYAVLCRTGRAPLRGRRLSCLLLPLGCR